VEKFFIDCGANTGQSIDLFINNWEDSKDYKIYSFEANKDFNVELNQKRYYYNKEGYSVSINVPVAVWDKETENELSLFGGGECAVVSDEKTATLGPSTIIESTRDFKPKSIRLSTWIKENLLESDYLVLKMDIEGSEYRIIKDMDQEGSLSFVNEFYYEWHGPKKGFSFQDDINTLDILIKNDITPYHWNGNWDKMKKEEVTKEKIENWYKNKGFKF